MSVAQAYVAAPLRSLKTRILNLFVVEPSSGRSLAYVDGLRAIAVMLVVSLHVWGRASAQLLIPLPVLPPLDLTPIVSHGGYGVQLFFVLSGFLLAQPWLKAAYLGQPRPSVRTYFKLRLFRIVPAYYLCLFLMLLFYTGVYIPAQFVYSSDGLFTLVAHLLFLQYVFPISSNSFTLDAPMWTLTMEMMFYVTLPLIVGFFARKRWMIALPVAAAISLGWLHACRTIFQPFIHFVYLGMQQNPIMGPGFDTLTANRYLMWQFPAQLVVFACGITCANLYVWYGLRHPERGIAALLTNKWAGLIYFLAGWALTLGTVYPNSPLVHFLGRTSIIEGDVTQFYWGYYLTKPLVGIGFALVVMGITFGSSWLKGLFSVTPLRLIGIVSYSMYLWQTPIIRNWIQFQQLKTLPLATHFQVLFVISVVSIFLFSCFSYLAVEKPFMLIARRRARAQREKAAAERARAAAAASAHEGGVVPTQAGSGAAVPAFAAVSDRGR